MSSLELHGFWNCRMSIHSGKGTLWAWLQELKEPILACLDDMALRVMERGECLGWWIVSCVCTRATTTRHATWHPSWSYAI
jgi:hypothetical protein